MRVLVTGATGFVAGHLLPSLAAAGHDVVALGHQADRIPALPGVTPLVLDLEAFGDGDLPAVDAIVHLAQANVPWPDQADRLFAVNVASTQRLLEHARRCGARSFVHASSASVYGAGDPAAARPFLEDDEPRGRDFYAVTKRSAELLVAAYANDLDVTSLRLVAPYGPGQVRRLVPGLIGRIRGGSAVTLNAGGRPAMNPIYVADAVRAVERLLAVGGPAVLNLAGDEPVTIRQLAEAIGAAAGVTPLFEDAPGGGVSAGDIVCDNARLHALLGDEPLTPLAAGLARTLAATPAA